MHELEYDTGKIILYYYRNNNNNNNVTPIITRQTVIWAARSNGHWSFDKIQNYKITVLLETGIASYYTKKYMCIECMRERERERNKWAKEYNIIIVYKIVHSTTSVSIRRSETKRFGTTYV